MALIYGPDDRPIEKEPEPVPIQPSKQMHTVATDGCCARPLKNAAEQGILDHVPSFTCPRCGTEYRPIEHGPVKNWVAQCDVMIFGRR